MWLPFLNWLVLITRAERSDRSPRDGTRSEGGRDLGWWTDGDGYGNASPPPRSGSPRGRAGHPARAVLRPRLRPRDHAVHGADVQRPHLGRARTRAPRARRALVVVDRIRLADERRRPRGGRGADRDLRGDGRAADRRDLRARGLRQPRTRVRARLWGSAGRAHRALRPREPR